MAELAGEPDCRPVSQSEIKDMALLCFGGDKAGNHPTLELAAFKIWVLLTDEVFLPRCCISIPRLGEDCQHKEGVSSKGSVKSTAAEVSTLVLTGQ